MRTERMRLGQEAEEFVANEIARRGYEIVERNFRWRGGEIDIIARNANEMVFVEVRSRGPDIEMPEDAAARSVRGKKRHLVKRSAAVYLASRPIDYVECRFFLACVGWYDERPRLRIIEDAM